MKIALVFIFLCIYECWVNGKFLHPAVAKHLNGNDKAFLQKYLQPIQTIAQQFPDRAIEVQLEVSQDKPSLKPNKLPMPLLKSPIQTVHKMHRRKHHKLRSIRDGGDNNSNKNVHRRYILPADFYDLGDDDEEYVEMDVPILKAKKEEKPTTAKAKTSAKTTKAKATTKTTKKAKSTTTKTTTKPTTKTTTQTTTKIATTTHETTTTAAPTYPDPGKKPVYMDDLVNALSEFENKIMATTTFEPNPDTPQPEINELINEGNRPLLKKDLWLALGMNQANCPQPLGSMVADYNLEDLGDEEPEQESPKRDNTNLDIIMNLLKRGVRIQHDAPNPKENQNLQWFQVKVPKT